MNMSSQKQSSSTGVVLGHKFLSFARSRLPVANKPRTRRALISVAPIPFAPLVDTHAFQPPPPYSAHADTSAFLRVPHNTPEVSPRRRTSKPIGLGLEGVERGDGCQFDGLGRLSGGFRAVENDALREQVHRMLSAQRRRRTSEPPMTRHDVFYGSEQPRLQRGTISSELKRAASLARRDSVRGSTQRWRV